MTKDMFMNYLGDLLRKHYEGIKETGAASPDSQQFINGYMEAGRKLGKEKKPLRFSLKSREPFGLAGLYETWISPEQKPFNTCTIITTEPNDHY